MDYRASIILAVLLFVANLKSSAQIQVAAGSTVADSRNLAITSLVGTNTTISNQASNNNVDPSQIGIFDHGGQVNPVIGIEEGIILSSGSIGEAEDDGNPVANGSSFTTSPSISSDPDLANMASGQVDDAAVIEFDFVATEDNISFNYVFASNEYTCEDFWTQVRDVFGIFISGPGITGPFSNNARNIAVILDANTGLPITNAGGNTIPVACHTINGNTRPALFNENRAVRNPTSIGCLAAQASGNRWTFDVDFEGWTDVLQTEEVSLQCGETYHVKIAIADVVDERLSSFVLVERNSLDFLPDFEVSGPDFLCDGEEGTFSVSPAIPGATYSWYAVFGATPNNTSPTVTGFVKKNPGTPRVTVTYPGGCEVLKLVDMGIQPINDIPLELWLDDQETDECQSHDIVLRIGETASLTETVTFRSADRSDNIIVDMSSLPPSTTISDFNAASHLRTLTFRREDDNIGTYCFDVTATQPDHPCPGPNFTNTVTKTYCVKIVCEDCVENMLYENRAAPTNPLPNETRVLGHIKAGTDVDAPSTNGPVTIAQNEDVLFEASCVVRLEDGFTVKDGGELVARIDPGICSAEDCDCCVAWNGYSTNLTIPTLVNANQTGWWQIFDYANPNCAYNAKCFELRIIDAAGRVVETISGGVQESNDCCPFVSPSAPGESTLASIRWYIGQASSGVYDYELKLCGCGEDLILTGNFEVINGEPALNTSVTGGNPESALSELEVFPIPVANKLQWSYQGSIDRVTILGTNGQVIISNTSVNQNYLDVSKLVPGNYYLQVDTDQERVIKGFVKK